MSPSYKKRQYALPIEHELCKLWKDTADVRESHNVLTLYLDLYPNAVKSSISNFNDFEAVRIEAVMSSTHIIQSRAYEQYATERAKEISKTLEKLVQRAKELVDSCGFI